MALARLLACPETLEVTIPSGPKISDRPKWFLADGWRVLAYHRENIVHDVDFQRFSLPGNGSVSATFDASSGRVGVPFDLEEAYQTLVSESWRRSAAVRQLPSSGLSAYYRVKRLIPRRIQLGGRRALARWQGAPEFPSWPFERSVVELLRFYVKCLLLGTGRSELPFRWFWPDRKAAALTLTHDVESAEGLRLSLGIADLEQERGFRSSFNIVASWYPIDIGIVSELQGRGFEIGVHGVYHDRSMFSTREEFESQLSAVRDAMRRFRADGFRSPSTHRVHRWLGELPLLYDCSVPHSDPYEPQPGGCCSIWPFFIGDVVELPYTVPQDHTVFTILRHTTIDLWLRQLNELSGANGLVQLVSHPDPGYLGDGDKRSLYSEMLDALSERTDLWRVLPRDAARWWRQRDRGDGDPYRAVVGVARLVDGYVDLVPEP